MRSAINTIYQPGMSAVSLADKLVNEYFSGKVPSFPLNPFKMMRNIDIVFQFMEFKDLEGIYIVPENDEDIAVIGINAKRPITRQRFTAAHEICHHLKDRNSSICAIGSRTSVERYADQFASELLMPIKYLKDVANKYIKDEYVSFNDALSIAEYFGVSFKFCINTLAYKLHLIDGITETKKLTARIRKFKPDLVKAELGIEKENTVLLEQVVNSYEFYWNIGPGIAWYKFKSDFIYNENRLERLNLDHDVVSEIITDLRMKKNESEYCKESYEEIIQVLGHAAMYDFIFETQNKLSIYKIQDLNRQLYQFAPYPEAGGVYRQENNMITGAEFETVDYSQVVQSIINLDSVVRELLLNIDTLEYSEFIEKTVAIHHRITVIHPFRDGNGRSSRAFLNWMFRLKGIPPIYIKFPEKDDYYDGLKDVDENGDYRRLYKVFLKEVIRSAMQLNKTNLDEIAEEED